MNIKMLPEMHKHVIKVEEIFSNILIQFDRPLKVKT